MESQDRIFRQAALDRLSSPEQLDQLMQVTTPKSWMALVAFIVLLLNVMSRDHVQRKNLTIRFVEDRVTLTTDATCSYIGDRTNAAFPVY